MWLRLTPEQVSEYWDLLSLGVRRSILQYKGEYEVVNGVLSMLMGGTAVCWVCVGEDKVKGMMVGGVYSEPVFKERHFLILSVYNYSGMGEEDWREGLLLVRRYAKGEGCKRITGYTNSKSAMALVVRVGGSLGFRYIELEV